MGWDKADLPAVWLLNAVMDAKATSSVAFGASYGVADGAPSSAAVSALGMGGVGKTLSCLLVARHVMQSPAGRQRFRNGVF